MMCVHGTCAQGPEWFEAARTGDPSREWALLQQLSWRDPEALWLPLLLHHLRVTLHHPPAR